MKNHKTLDKIIIWSIPVLMMIILILVILGMYERI